MTNKELKEAIRGGAKTVKDLANYKIEPTQIISFGAKVVFNSKNAKLKKVKYV